MKTVQETITATTKYCGRGLPIDSEYIMTIMSEKAKALKGRTRKSSGIEHENTAVEEPFSSRTPFLCACLLPPV